MNIINKLAAITFAASTTAAVASQPIQQWVVTDVAVLYKEDSVEVRVSRLAADCDKALPGIAAPALFDDHMAAKDHARFCLANSPRFPSLYKAAENIFKTHELYVEPADSCLACTIGSSSDESMRSGPYNRALERWSR